MHSLILMLLCLISNAQAETVIRVNRGETLQDVSKRLYGTTRKWQKIYQNNRDVISSPNHLYEGMELRVAADLHPQKEVYKAVDESLVLHKEINTNIKVDEQVVTNSARNIKSRRAPASIGVSEANQKVLIHSLSSFDQIEL